MSDFDTIRPEIERWLDYWRGAEPHNPQETGSDYAYLDLCLKEIERLQEQARIDAEAIEALQDVCRKSKRTMEGMQAVVNAAKHWRVTETADTVANLIAAVDDLDAVEKEDGDA